VPTFARLSPTEKGDLGFLGRLLQRGVPRSNGLSTRQRRWESALVRINYAGVLTKGGLEIA